jgi:hypothetical protein
MRWTAPTWLEHLPGGADHDLVDVHRRRLAQRVEHGPGDVVRLQVRLLALERMSVISRCPVDFVSSGSTARAV